MTALLLSGCGTAHSNGGFSLIEYSDEKQGKAADEMDGGMCPVLNEFMNDYSVLRDQVRVK